MRIYPGLNFAVASSLIDAYLRKFIGNLGPVSPPGGNLGSSPSQFNGPDCWFQENPGSQRLVGSRCQVTGRNASQDRIEIQLINANGLKRVNYLRPGDSGIELEAVSVALAHGGGGAPFKGGTLLRS